MLRELRRDLHRRARRSARARQPPRARHPARHALRARSLRQLPAGQAARRAAVSAEGPRPDGRQLRRLSREHRGALRQHRRPLQGRHRRRDRDPGRDQHLSRACTASSGTPSSSRRRARPDEGLHGRQEQRDDAGARAVAARVQGGRRRVSRRSRRRTTTSTRWRCTWCSIPAQFEVIVTNNLFGDIITDLGGDVPGRPRAWRRRATSIPGRRRCSSRCTARRRSSPGRTSPTRSARFSSAALMLETLGLRRGGRGDRRGGAEGRRCDGQVTPDIGGTLGTRESGRRASRSDRLRTCSRLSHEGHEVTRITKPLVRS